MTESEKSVAVLPFADLSPGSDQAWFSDGLTEEILNSLAHLPELKVISRTSSFYFRERDVPLGESADMLLHYLLGDTREPPSDTGTTGEFDEEAVYERMISSYEAAVAHAPDSGTRLIYQINREFVSKDWRDLPALLDRLDVEHMNRRAEFVLWIPHILTAFGRAEQGLRLLDALLERNVLGRMSFALAAKLAYPAKGAESALEYVARGKAVGAGPAARKRCH